MKSLRWCARVAAAGLMAAGMAGATQALAAGSAPLVEWLTPAAPRQSPQTDAQEEFGKTHGRPLPTPEVLQPTLDPALPSYAPPAGLHLSGTFHIACSDVMPNLTRRWIAGFEKLYPDVHLILTPPFAGSLGAVELAKGKLDGVFVSRELRPSDIDAFKAKFGYPPLSVPVSGGTWRQYGFLDSVVFFVNKDNPIGQLSFADLDRAFSSTHARGGSAALTWGDLGATGEWAKRPIHLYGIQPWNGFEEFVRQRVLSAHGERGEWRDGITYSKTVFPVASQVANDPDGIGYSGLAFIDAPVKLLPLQAEPGDAFVPPSYTQVALANYPLSRLVYFNTDREPGKPLNPVFEQFLHYILSRQGQQKVLDEAIYLPLRASQVNASRQLIAP